VALFGRKPAADDFRRWLQSGHRNAVAGPMKCRSWPGPISGSALGIVALGAMLAGCVTGNETVSFKSSNPQRQTMMRDGQPAIVSR
jgi:hypothetical protein